MFPTSILDHRGGAAAEQSFLVERGAVLNTELVDDSILDGTEGDVFHSHIAERGEVVSAEFVIVLPLHRRIGCLPHCISCKQLKQMDFQFRFYIF